MQFSLIGFRQDTGFRVFTFEGTAADHTRTAYTVRADLALTRKHGIRVQEFALLCREILGRRRATVHGDLHRGRDAFARGGAQPGGSEKEVVAQTLTHQAGNET